VGGYLYINGNASLQADNLTSVGGHLSIHNKASLQGFISVGGYLSIRSKASLPALTSVGGYLYINSNVSLQADNLTSVGGYLSINSTASLPALTSVGGYLSIRSKASLQADNLTSVSGDLYINSKASLPALTSVGGYLYIDSNASLQADNLTSVTGDLYISNNASLPALTSVGGYLSIRSKASLQANNLTSIGEVRYNTTMFNHEITVIDDIGCVILSTKTQNEIEIKSCRKATFKDSKLTGDKFYVVSQNGYNAHGKTIKLALMDLAFKQGNRDIDEFINMPLDTIKSPEEWAFIYRCITGACQYGIEQFIKSKGKLKSKYTLEEIIAETQGAYASDKFVNVIRKGNKQ
jgi:acyl-[acyl carrier protein]--UDP-N-acetylglucosamine O-acyltransferase